MTKRERLYFDCKLFGIRTQSRSRLRYVPKYVRKKYEVIMKLFDITLLDKRAPQYKHYHGEKFEEEFMSAVQSINEQ